MEKIHEVSEKHSFLHVSECYYAVWVNLVQKFDKNFIPHLWLHELAVKPNWQNMLEDLSVEPEVHIQFSHA